MGLLPAATEAVRFGKYRLVARLATGGMAEIFLARLQGAAGFEKLVCIKRILPHLARDKHFVAMFFDEARIASRITHPNVCQVFELGEIEGSYYLAMEYLDGVPLSCFRRHDYHGALPSPRLVAGIAVQACEGLHHAHQLKNAEGRVMEVVHRDVSPQNLFVTVDGIVKVLDFGIAKVQDATIRTSTGAVKGTYAYMAPEQLRGERVDRRTDVFALGIAMWETLTRRHLFKRDTEFLTFQAITADPVEDVCAIRSDVPLALSSVIMKALSRDRSERHPTARALGEAIASAIQPLGAPAIGEEIASAFPAQLAEQAELIRVARSGGAFALDADRGPSVGRGTDVPTTPVSARSGLSQRARLDTSLDISPRGRDTSTGPPRHDTSSDAPGTVVAPPLQARRSWRQLAVAVAALAVGGAGAFVYMQAGGEPVRREAPALRDQRGAGETRALPSQLGERSGVALAIDAAAPAALATEAPPIVPPDAALRNVAPPNDAPVAASADARPPSPPRPPRAPRPAGPPGTITFDCTSGWATIYVDGKKAGLTPMWEHPVPPGRHAVRAISARGTEDFSIVIESGKSSGKRRLQCE